MDIYDDKSTIELFQGAIDNANTVSILLSGPSGSGKTHTIERVLEERKLKRKYLSATFAPITSEGWFALMGELMRDQVKVLIVDNIEDMPMPAQAAMFHAFSNTYGELSSFPDSSYGVKAVFTTVKSITELRSSADMLMPHVYDRISQLIIRFYPLTNTQNLWARFKEVWKALDFQKENHLPSEGGLRQWITGNVEKMNGNYRDLEKLAIRWHNRRLMKFEEDRILENINREYKEVGFGAEPEEDGAVFRFSTLRDWASIDQEFRRFIRDWALKEYGSAKAAADALDVSPRTMERWK